MLATAEIIAPFNTLQTYSGDTSDYLKPDHPLHEPLKQLLSYLNFKEESLSGSMEKFCTEYGLIFNEEQWHPAVRERLIKQIKAYFGDEVAFVSTLDIESPSPMFPSLPPLSILETPDNKISVRDGQVQLILNKKAPGVYWIGNEDVGKFLQQYPNEIHPEISPVSLRVIDQVSRNEGKLDAINTYDQAFLSIGIFQWTLGVGSNAGELPALLYKLKAKAPDKFRQWFTPLSIDIDRVTDFTTGFITFRGERMEGFEQKELFRSPSWAFHFWKALMQPAFQAIQIEHAHDRFKHFYFKPEPDDLPYPLYQIITSSYGVALLLDQHVNRPGWVNACIGLAMAENIDFSSPDHWETREESKIIESYLKIRATYTDGRNAPMTAALSRAHQIKLGLQNGYLSADRGSFEYLVQKPMEGFGLKGNQKSSLLPPNYHPDDYPDIWQENQ
jgi:hypothetical protein